MEKNKMFTIIIWSITGLLLIIIFVAAYKVIETNRENSLRVMNQKIKEAARLCYLREECEDQITLKDLYDKEYLPELVINPVTREYLDEDMCIEYIDRIIEFCD